MIKNHLWWPQQNVEDERNKMQAKRVNSPKLFDKIHVC